MACPNGGPRLVSFSRGIIFTAILVLPLTGVGAVFSLDDGTVDASGGTPGGDLLALNHFDTGGRTVVIDQISVLWNPISSAVSPTVALYLDPNGDGNPNDAVPLVIVPFYIPGNLVILNNTTLQDYAIPATVVAGSFFAGAYLSDGAGGFDPIIGVDMSHPQPNQSWILENTSWGRLDLEAPAATSTSVAPLNQYISGNHMIRARYTIVPSCTPIPAGVVGYWPGDDSARDAAGTNNGTVIGAVGYGPGMVRRAFQYNGLQRARVDLGNPLDMRVQDLTIQGWVRRSSATEISLDDQGEDGSQTGEGGFILSYGKSGYGFGLKDNGALFLAKVDAAEVSMPGVSDTNWHHVAVAKSGTNVTFYVDGSAIGTTTFDRGFDFDTLAAIGSRGDARGGTFFGVIDEVALFNRGMGADEVQAIYVSGATGFCPISPGGAPAIVSQPLNQTKRPSSVATLAVVATGSSPLSYQWYFNGDLLDGRTASAFTLASVQSSNAGAYWVTVSNRFGVVTSTTAELQVSVLPPPVCLSAPTGAVAWWRAETNGMDAIGINDALMRAGSAPENYYSTGKAGAAFRLVGNRLPIYGTNYLFVPRSADLDLGGGEGLSLEGWIRSDTLAGFQPVVEWNDGGGNIGAGLALNGSALEGWFTDTNTSPIARVVMRSPVGIVVTSAWQHVGLTFYRDTGTATLYLNGVAVAQTNVAGLRPQTRAPVYLGFRPSGNYARSACVGSIDELTLYSRALAGEEMEAIVEADSKGKCLPPPPACTPAAADVAAWWRWENNLVDSVDGNNGTMVNLVRYTNGVVGRAAWVQSGYVRVPASTNLDLGAGPGLTIEGWFWPELGGFSFGKGGQEFVGWHNIAVTQAVNLSFQSVFGRLGSSDFCWAANLADNAGRAHPLTAPVGFGQVEAWQHVAVTYDRVTGLAVLFFNGHPVVQTNLGMFTPLTQGDLYLGYQPPSSLPPHYSPGPSAIDDVSLYRRALTPAEIRSLMVSRGTGKCREAPAIVSQPASVRVNEGETAVFSVAATGTPVLKYVWRWNGSTLSGTTESSLVLRNVRGPQAGVYSVRVVNAFGLLVSSNAVLSVNRPPVADATASGPVVMVPLGCLPTVVLDGSRSSDPDGDVLHFMWSQDGTGSPLATGAVAVVRLPFGTSVLTLTVDDGLATNRQDLTVEVITPAQAVERLAASLSRRVSRSQPLVVTLLAAAAAIEREGPTPAINQLQAFQKKTQAQVGSTDPTSAAELNVSAQNIIDVLAMDCYPRPHGRIGKVLRHANGKMRIEFSAPRGPVYIVEASTDLLTWQKVGVAMNSGWDQFGFEDTQAPSSAVRFYRILVAETHSSSGP
jgi:hypothetical protein